MASVAVLSGSAASAVSHASTNFVRRTIAKIEADQFRMNTLRDRIFQLSKLYVKNKPGPIGTNPLRSYVMIMLTESLFRTLRDGIRWIQEKVPKATGQLQDDLIEVLKKSSVVGTTLELLAGVMPNAGSNDYIDYVAGMSQQMLRHPKGGAARQSTMYRTKTGKRYKTRFHWNPGAFRYVNYYPDGAYRRIPLYDPGAVANWWSRLKQYLIKRLMDHWRQVVREKAVLYNLPIRPFTEQLRVQRV